MSQLSLFAGPDLIEEPQIFSFKEYASKSKGFRSTGIEQRARLRKENQSCPCCSRVTVEPVELEDSQYGRNGAKIAGTGTIVGFSCNACGHEWPV
ncbi:hypothetical protein [Thalassoglobus polymorphus]|uniref:Uncharacterized protein n=1 Tax=Thalassoglobus polymorphus TaxID=2527994 RepID=A0A517QRN5_9PLAN|nr:hypothetical protein [Thalassoglobus polymorphus]QDT34283.1 hypothetical protein Mal48_35430 [Thalassoglobus polymorphus]